jgi:hypothetical protein
MVVAGRWYLPSRNTIMNIRKIVFIAAASAALCPAISSASTEGSALDACARAFALRLAPPGAAAPSYKLAYGSSPFGSLIEPYSLAYTFELRANDKKTGLPIARASCSTDTRGAVISLSSSLIAKN